MGTEIDRAEAALEKAQIDLAEAGRLAKADPAAPEPVAESDRLDFKKHLKPIFETHCTSCHSGRVVLPSSSVVTPPAALAYPPQ